MSTTIKLRLLTTRCYKFVSGLSGGKRIRRPLDASSSMHRRPLISLAELMFSLDSLGTSSTTWNSIGSPLLGLLPSISSVCVSAVFMPNSIASSEGSVRLWPRISVASSSAFPTAGHSTTSETFCHKTCRKFFKLTSFWRFREGSARDSMKSFFRRELLAGFCRSRVNLSSPGDTESSGDCFSL